MIDTGSLSRRTLLAALGAGAVGAALCTPALARKRISGVRTLDLRHEQTGERFDGIYHADGLYEPEAMDRLDTLMRDFHADESTIMDVRLYDLFSEIQDSLGTGEPLIITSGYRTRATNDALRRRNRWAARNSLHIPGMAADIKVHGVAPSRLVKAAKTLKRGGVGAYRGANFIHVDVGEIRSWRR